MRTPAALALVAAAATPAAPAQARSCTVETVQTAAAAAVQERCDGESPPDMIVGHCSYVRNGATVLFGGSVTTQWRHSSALTYIRCTLVAANGTTHFTELTQSGPSASTAGSRSLAGGPPSICVEGWTLSTPFPVSIIELPRACS